MKLVKLGTLIENVEKSVSNVKKEKKRRVKIFSDEESEEENNFKVSKSENSTSQPRTILDPKSVFSDDDGPAGGEAAKPGGAGMAVARDAYGAGGEPPLELGRLQLGLHVRRLRHAEHVPAKGALHQLRERG